MHVCETVDKEDMKHSHPPSYASVCGFIQPKSDTDFFFTTIIYKYLEQLFKQTKATSWIILNYLM